MRNIAPIYFFYNRIIVTTNWHNERRSNITHIKISEVLIVVQGIANHKAIRYLKANIWKDKTVGNAR